MTRLIAFTVFTLTSLLVAAPSNADEESDARHPVLEDTFVLSGGAFLHTKDLNIGVEGTSPTERVDFDKTWNLGDQQTRFAGELMWRFGEKWSFRGQYFDSSDSARAVLDEDVSWEDYTLEAGSNIGAGVEFSVARLFFGRDFSVGPNHEFGLGFGVHWMDLEAFVDGEFFLNGESTGVRRESVGASAPLPNVGAWYGYAFSPRWLFTSRVDWLSVNINEYDGGFTNISAGIEFQAFEHFGVGLNYQFFKLDIDVDKDSWRGSAKVSYDGPFVYASANW